MMSKESASNSNCRRYHIWLDKDDAEWFKGMFHGDLGFSAAIREVMRSYRRGLEEKINQEAQAKGRRLSEGERDQLFASAGVKIEGEKE